MIVEKEIKGKIISNTYEMFCQLGYNKVTMEDIASNLGISKKTLYKHFSNKDHLLREMVSEIKCEVEIAIENILNLEIDFMDKLKMLMDYLSKQSNKLQGQHIKDLIKNHSDIWNDLQNFRKKNIIHQFTKLIDEGMKNGIFRNDLNKEVIVLMYFGAIHELINPDILSALPLSGDQVFNTIITILFEGILSEDGREKYSTYKNVNKVNEVNVC